LGLGPTHYFLTFPWGVASHQGFAKATTLDHHHLPMYARHAAAERDGGGPSHLGYHYPQGRYEDPETPTESGADFYNGK